MSGPLRRLIGPAKARLLRYLKEAAPLLTVSVEEKTMEEQEFTIEELIKRINTTICLLERCNRDWASLLKEIDGEERTKEEAEYQKVTEGSESFIEVLLDAGEIIARLEARLKIITRTGGQTKIDKTLPHQPATELSGLKINLPKLQLPTFDGNIKNWQEFWDAFKSSIDEQTNLSDVSKFSYLKGILRGSALSAITGIPITGDNYPLVVKLLKERFGNKEAIIESLYSKLQNLRRAGSGFSDIRRTCDEIEKCLRQLEAQGEPVNEQRTLIQQIISKFPMDVIIKLEESKEPMRPWTMPALREAICRYVTVHENVHRYVSNSSIQKGQSGFNNNNNSGQVRNQPLTPKGRHVQQIGHTVSTEVLTANSQRSGVQQASLPCIFCKGTHFNDMCDKFSSLDERRQSLSQQGRCFICLKVGHMLKDCPSSQKKSCCYCSRRGSHNRCLCPQKFGRQSTEAFMTNTIDSTSQTSALASLEGNSTNAGYNTAGSTGSSTHTADVSSNTALLASGERVLLQTAIVQVQNLDELVTVKANALMDSASQRTFMTEQLAKRLRLKPEGDELLSVSTFGAGKAIGMDTYTVRFGVKLNDGSCMMMCANVLKHITGNIRRSSLYQRDLEFLQMIPRDKMADTIPSTVETMCVDLLIGSDYFWDIIGGDRITLPSGMYMLPSKFGYIVTGRCPEIDKVQHNNSCALFVAIDLSQGSDQSVQCSVNVSITKNPTLEMFWNLETIGIRDPVGAESDDDALMRFGETIRYENGRYQVTWPWKSDDISLPDNYQVAEDRMKSLVRRLQTDSKLLHRYDETLKQQLEQGVIELIDPGEESKFRQHYLPHHPIVTPGKSTTKLRIVYDASSKAKRELNSLNDCLFRGPVILPDLCGLLLRFRLYPIVIVADIEKAFLQLGIQTCDRDVTRFLWLKDINKLDIRDNLATYRFCRVPFGLICSPFLLGATIQLHLEKENTPLALHILTNIYVDNVLIGLDSGKGCSGIYKEAKLLFQKAAMNLREWNSNCVEFLRSLPIGERTSSRTTKVLGLLWDEVEDTISIGGFDKVDTSKQVVVTKRDVLHVVAKVFDPLGLLTPLTLLGKLFLQKLWRLNQSWDDPLSDDLLGEWNNIVESFWRISSLKISRFIGIVNEGTKQLLVFCDASMRAYATAIYLRIDDGNQCQINLLFSKVRLVPVGRGKRKPGRHLTIPRLELLAILIGVRASKFVLKHLKLEVSSWIVWSDSQCALQWLKSTKPLSVFVENRIKEILRERDVTFRYIVSSHNPADLATRGLTFSEINDSSLWWNGPLWLGQDLSVWPTWNTVDITPEVLEQVHGEIRGPKTPIEMTTMVGVDKSQQDTASLFTLEKKCSSLRKLLRVSVYVLKFIKIKVWNQMSTDLQLKFQKHKLLTTILDNLKVHSSITSQEIKLASLLWIFFIQHRSYSDVYNAIKNKKKHCLQMQLGIKMDKFEVLTCHGRFLNADLDEEAKYPKLLPRGEIFTHLLIQEIHQRLIHAGVAHTLSQIRQEFWVPQGRAEVRRVLNKCTICKRHNGPSFRLPLMPPWPRERVSRSTAFQYVGLDYLGPIRVKEGESVEKMWVCLFTCLAIRAVHLELVRGLSAQQFLDCLRRFVARRGRPSMIISDNAPHFRLVKTVVHRQWHAVFTDEEVLSYYSREGITWKFTTALAPWQGGFYERLVSLVKQGLRKGMGRRLLYWDKLLTMLTEVEAMINTRPLTYVYGDFLSGFTLTPAHFLTGRLETVIPVCSDDVKDPTYQPQRDSAELLIDYWKKSQKQLDQFWHVWLRDYLLTLRETLPIVHKGSRSQISRQPKIGEIVLIKDDNLPRRTWKIAQITEHIFSKDGKIRSAVVQLPNKHFLTRSISHLYPLEIESSSNTTTTATSTPKDKDYEDTVDQRPVRRAAAEARDRILNQLNDREAVVTFVFPGSVMENS